MTYEEAVDSANNQCSGNGVPAAWGLALEDKVLVRGDFGSTGFGAMKGQIYCLDTSAGDAPGAWDVAVYFPEIGSFLWGEKRHVTKISEEGAN